MHKIINWDLDETIGEFTKNGKEYSGFLRPNIEKVLEYFYTQNFKNVLTTAAHRKYAQNVLEKFNLTKYFIEIFSTDDLGTPVGEKDYSHVTKYFGISHKDAMKNMIIIGNSIDDQPSIINNLVMILCEDVNKDASLIKNIIVSMQKDFERSFESMYSTKINSIGSAHVNLEKQLNGKTYFNLIRIL